MKLNGALFLQLIKKHYPDMVSFDFPTRAELTRPLFWDKNLSVSSNRLYVACDSETIDADQEDFSGCLFIFPGAVSEKERNYPCLFLQSQEPVTGVFNRIQGFFDIYDKWEQDLTKISLGGGSVQELLNISHPLLGNPLCVLGADFSLIASVGMQSLPQEYQIFNDSAKKIDYMNSMKQDRYFNSVQDAKDPFIFPSHITGLRSWNVNILRFGHTTHRLMMLEYPRQLNAADAYLLQFLASFMEYVLFQESVPSTSGEKALHSIFIHLLSDKAADYIKISQQLSALNWDPEHQYLALVLRISLFDQKNLTANTICSYIENLFPSSCSFQFKEEIVTFFNLTLLNLTEDEISQELTCFIRDGFLKAGYSRAMKGHMNLRRQYIQAGIALDLGTRQKPYLWIHRFNQVALSYILDESTRRLPGYMLCHEKLLVLKEMDETQNTEYLHTLQTYLNNHLNAVQSAKDLFIHRSTFLYRMDKIKHILECDLDNPDDILYLMFSFKLLEMENSRREIL